MRLGFFAEAEEVGGACLTRLGGLSALVGHRDALSLVLVGQHHWRPDDIDRMTVRDFVRALVITDTYNTEIAKAMEKE